MPTSDWSHINWVVRRLGIDRAADAALDKAVGATVMSFTAGGGQGSLRYGVYVDGKMIGSICDDQLYVKPTASGRLHAEPVSEAPPYPDAKPHLLMEADCWDDAERLSNLLRATATERPMDDFATANEEWIKWFDTDPPTRQGAKCLCASQA